MKILHLVSEITWRGGEQQVAYLLEQAGQHNNISCFIACPNASAMEEYCQQKGHLYFNLNFKTPWSSIEPLYHFCKKEHIDLIHMHSAKAHSLAVLAHWWMSVKGHRDFPKLILSKRTDFPIRKNFLSRYKYNYWGIEKILCVSDRIKEVITPAIKETDKLLTIYSGVDLSRFQSPQIHADNDLRKQFQLPQDTILVGNTSAIADHKDYPTFLRVAQEVRKKATNIHFVIMGKGPLEEEIKKLCSKMNLTNGVHFTGHIHEIENALPQLDIFLMTSKEEGLGTSILDAMSIKIPVVATRAGGIPEIVRHGETGLTASIKDDKLLAQHIFDLLSEISLRDTLVLNALEMLRENFTYKIMAQKTFNVYDKVLNDD